MKPWQKDPAYYKSIWTYKSDVPAHEGPTNHAIIELWQYTFPLDKESSVRLMESLKLIPSLQEQAKRNLTGNARDLWVTGIRDIKEQIKDLESLITKAGVAQNKKLFKSINNALSDRGVLIIEDPSLLKCLQNLAYDQFYCEHIYVFSTLALREILKKFKLEIFDIENTKRVC